MPKVWTDKDERKFEHIREACVARKGSRAADVCERMAAATVNRDRTREGRVKSSTCPVAQRFHRSVNMTPAQIRAWGQSSKSRIASEAGTRARIPKLATLKAKPLTEWTAADCAFAKRVVSFNARMGGMRKAHGAKPKLCAALRNWGRDAPGCAKALRRPRA